MSLISKQTAGILLIAGLGVILALNLILIQPFSTSLAFIIVLLIIIVFLYQPKWGLFFIILIRPTFDKLSETFSVQISENFSLNAAAFFGTLVVVLLGIFIAKNYKLLREIPLKQIWLIFSIISIVSIVYSIDVLASIYEIVRLFSIILIFFCFFIVSQKEKNPKIIIVPILLSAIIPFMFASYQMATSTGLGDTSGIESRLFGTFSHPNPFASFVFIVLSAVTYFLFFRKTEQKIIFYVFLFWSLVLLIGTYSRGAWLAFVIFLLFIILIKSPRYIFLLGTALVFLFLFSPAIHDRIQDIYNPPADSSVRWRFEQWGRMYDAFAKRPLTGYGVGTEIVVHENEYGYYAGNPYTHNDILKTAVETGIFGAIAYVLLVITTAVTLFQKYRKTKSVEIKNFVFISFALFAALTSFSLTNNTFRETATQWFLWAIIGTALAL